MKPKFQPIPSRISATKKCPSVTPESATPPAAARMRRPAAITRSTPKRAISAPVKNDGANIASTWPETTSAACGGGEAAADHGERRRGHHEVHQRVADHGDDHRHRDPRRADQLQARARPRAVGGGGRGRGLSRKAKSQTPAAFSAAAATIGAGEGHRRQRVGGEPHQLRPEHRRGEPRAHDVGDRPGAEVLAAAVGRGEAEEALRRHVEPGEERAGEEEPERAAHQRERAERRADAAADRAEHEAEPRPRRCISSESSGADSMLPTMITVIGSVARHWFGASNCPASPPRMKVTGSCEPSTTCAATSTQRLRRARAWATSGSGGD